ncbi:Hypothetical predicted protein [Podarcis lilfordi]|uniref:Uncharacterized protein n=1 Tax=Podarcis lilfordi TaxID=74358 RepID=A0AA35JT09_9SAUR|nr:Hypothetical predicted protein [Podarcis lilfordi]
MKNMQSHLAAANVQICAVSDWKLQEQQHTSVGSHLPVSCGPNCCQLTHCGHQYSNSQPQHPGSRRALRHSRRYEREKTTNDRRKLLLKETRARGWTDGGERRGKRLEITRPLAAQGVAAATIVSPRLNELRRERPLSPARPGLAQASSLRRFGAPTQSPLSRRILKDKTSWEHF